MWLQHHVHGMLLTRHAANNASHEQRDAPSIYMHCYAWMQAAVMLRLVTSDVLFGIM